MTDMGFRQTAIAAVAAAALVATGAAAHEFTAGDLTIGHPYAIETPPGAKAAAGYMSITNAGADDDRLEAVQAAGVEAALHLTETGADGVSRMLPVEGVDIPAGATVTLAPRGIHVMFVGLAKPWVAGDRIAATLFFERAGEVPVEFAVEARGAQPAGGHDMGGMQH